MSVQANNMPVDGVILPPAPLLQQSEPLLIDCELLWTDEWERRATEPVNIFRDPDLFSIEYPDPQQHYQFDTYLAPYWIDIAFVCRLNDCHAVPHGATWTVHDTDQIKAVVVLHPAGESSGSNCESILKFEIDDPWSIDVTVNISYLAANVTIGDKSETRVFFANDMDPLIVTFQPDASSQILEGDSGQLLGLGGFDRLFALNQLSWLGNLLFEPFIRDKWTPIEIVGTSKS